MDKSSFWLLRAYIKKENFRRNHFFSVSIALMYFSNPKANFFPIIININEFRSEGKNIFQINQSGSPRRRGFSGYTVVKFPFKQKSGIVQIQELSNLLKKSKQLSRLERDKNCQSTLFREGKCALKTDLNQIRRSNHHYKRSISY